MKTSQILLILIASLVMGPGLRAGENLLKNGDLSLKKPGFGTPAASELAEVTVIEGKAVPGKPAPGGKRVLQIDLKSSGYSYASYQGGKVPVNPAHKYRVKVQAYVTDGVMVNCGGYGHSGTYSQPVTITDGKVWQYYLIALNKGPTKDGWQAFETTIGPDGSGCKTTWDTQIDSISLSIWFGQGPGKIYLSDFVIEEF